MIKLKKRIMSLLLCGAMVFSLCPQTASAVSIQRTAADSSLCEHHTEHNGDCGYSEGSEGTPCTHQHTDECYIEVTNCVHEHDEGCYLETGDSVSDNTATPSNAEEREPEHCNHVCSEENGCIMEKLDCQHEHDSECGYSPAVEGTPCGYVCEICNPADSEEPEAKCVCEILCAEENINTDCPICGAEDADLTQCAGKETNEQVKTVQELIDALPTAEKLNDMSKDEQNEAYNALQAAYDAYEGLTDEQKAQIVGAEIFESLFTFFNGMTNALATVNGVNYLDADGNRQTANNVTVIDGNSTTWDSGWYVVNSNVTISNRVTVNGEVHLILADGCTLNAGNRGINVGENQSLTIYGQNSGSGKLIAAGGNYEAGIGSGFFENAGNITINGGNITATGGHNAAGIGGGSEGNGGEIVINGGMVKATGGGDAPDIGGGARQSVEKIVIGDRAIVTNCSGDPPTFSSFHGINYTVLAFNDTQHWHPCGTNGCDDPDHQSARENHDWTSKTNLIDECLECGIKRVNYLDENGDLKTAHDANVTVVDENSARWTSGWYVVSSNVTIDKRVTVSGEVHLILADGCTLTVNGGIQVQDNDTDIDNGSPNALTIYARSNGENMGTLIADASKAESSIANPAGIGSVQNGACGIITINGGIINATGQVRGSGIGGSYRGAGGTITINGGVVIANTSGDATGIGGGTFSASGNITITGGDVTATGGTRSAGIGGSQYGRDGNITITGGKVTATGGSSGIGVGYNGSGCTFSTGDNGNAFIVASSISDKSDKDNWSGIIFEGNNGQVYGNQTLSEDMEVPSGKTLTIPESVTLTIPEVVTLTDNGTITGSGAIDGSGQIMGNGTIENSITVDSSITIADTVKYQRLSSVTISFNTTDSTAEYGSTITITATAAKTTTRANSARATVNTVEFFVNGTSLGTAQVSGNTATLNSVILSEGNGWKIGSNTVTAEFGGSDYLREATGTSNFTVTAVKLQKPGNLQWDSTTPGKATWSEVINASGYSI